MGEAAQNSVHFPEHKVLSNRMCFESQSAPAGERWRWSVGRKDTVAAGRPFTTTDYGESERQQRTKVRYKEQILAMDKIIGLCDFLWAWGVECPWLLQTHNI